MVNGAKKEYLRAIRIRYLEASKKEKSIILDEFCINCKYNRKYAIRLIRASAATGKSPGKHSGRRKKYHLPEIVDFLKELLRASNLICSKRLKAAIPMWLPHYSKSNLTDNVKCLLMQISSATIDRLLSQFRKKYSKYGLATTKPGSLIRKHIPIKTNQWNESHPGFLEADTVAHCGNSISGSFVYTVNTVDIATGWTEQRAAWGKGQKGVFEALQSIESCLPFPIIGFDSDNGTEFLNYHLYSYFVNRKKPVQYTRSRAYHKNDNAHIEQKNWTNIRQYLGYLRFDNPDITSLLNELYTSEWRLFFNFFIPSVKLIDKLRIGSKVIKIHDAPKTPFHRLLESDSIKRSIKKQLQAQFVTLNPYALQKAVREKVLNILKLAAGQAS